MSPAGRIDRTTASGKFDELASPDSIFVVKDTYSIRELQRDTAGAVRVAEEGALVTVTRNDRAVAHVISSERLESLLETMEFLGDQAFGRELRKLQRGKLKFHPVDDLAD